MSEVSKVDSSLSKTHAAVNGQKTNGSLPDDNLHTENGVNGNDNTFGATVIKSRAVNYLLTKLRCKETSGRVSIFRFSY